MVCSKHLTSVSGSTGRSVFSVCINMSWQPLPQETPKDVEMDEERDDLGHIDKEKDGQTEQQ